MPKSTCYIKNMNIQLPTPEDIENACRERGISVAALCRKAGVNQSIFVKWKAGKTITLESARKLVGALDS